jgi:histidine phosphotransfer protein HptB
MAYDPGALEAALAAAVGDEPGLIAELRVAFFASAELHISALTHAASLAEWRDAATRLHSLAASFGAVRLMDDATQAANADRIDAAILRKIERTIAALDL